MSLTTWKKKYYPVAANTPMTAVQACEHSLRKWRGLTKAILKKYKLRKSGYEISDRWDRFSVDCFSCALCYKFDDDCAMCPIFKVGVKVCDDELSPFLKWLTGGNPGPMILALKKALAWAKKQEKE